MMWDTARSEVQANPSSAVHQTTCGIAMEEDISMVKNLLPARIFSSFTKKDNRYIFVVIYSRNMRKITAHKAV